MNTLRIVMGYFSSTDSAFHSENATFQCRFRWFAMMFFIAIIPLFVSQCAHKNARKGNVLEVMRIINEDRSVTYMHRIHNRYVLYTQPKEFKAPVISMYNSRSFFMASYLEGENNTNWTQLISVHSSKIFDSDEFTLDEILQGRMEFYAKFCAPKKTSSLQDFSDIKSINNYESTFFVLACGEMIRKDLEGSLETFHVNIKVPDGYYSIIWSERGPYLDKPITIDREKWMKRFKQLRPMSVFDNFPPKPEESSSPSHKAPLVQP